MAGFGIQKRGTSPLIVKRKKFAEGSDPIIERGVPDKILPNKTNEEVIKEIDSDTKINLKPDKNAKPTKAPIEESNLSKEKPPKEEEKLQFRCAGPNPSKKCGHRDEKKKGGIVKKGILIIVGTKNKESKKKKK